MESYKELEVWKKAVELVVEMYQTTKRFPREEIYTLVSQIRRAAISIPANIAEGWARGTTKEYLQYLKIARGSLMELETHVIISQRVNCLREEELEKLSTSIQQIGKMLNGLIKSLSRKQGIDQGLGSRE